MTCSRPGCPPSSCCCNGAPTNNHLIDLPVQVTISDTEDSRVQELEVIVMVSDVLPPMPYQLVQEDMPVVFFNSGLNRLTEPSNMDLTTGTGMLYTCCSNRTSSWATAHIFYAASGQQPASAVESHLPHPHSPPDWLASLESLIIT
jgi:hypothetical protein